MFVLPIHNAGTIATSRRQAVRQTDVAKRFLPRNRFKMLRRHPVQHLSFVAVGARFHPLNAKKKVQGI
jgi:hypothetical protein